jgi:hypothetical protein
MRSHGRRGPAALAITFGCDIQDADVSARASFAYALTPCFEFTRPIIREAVFASSLYLSRELRARRPVMIRFSRKDRYRAANFVGELRTYASLVRWRGMRRFLISMPVGAFLLACLAAMIGVGVAQTLAGHPVRHKPSRIELRQMAIAQSRPADRPLPVKALTAPEMQVKELAANLDEAERAEAGDWNGQAQALMVSRRSLARRLANLE